MPQRKLPTSPNMAMMGMGMSPGGPGGPSKFAPGQSPRGNPMPPNFMPQGKGGEIMRLMMALRNAKSPEERAMLQQRLAMLQQQQQMMSGPPRGGFGVR